MAPGLGHLNAPRPRTAVPRGLRPVTHFDFLRFGLTPQECQLVLDALAGHPTVDIAEHHALDEGAVARGLATALEKLGVHDEFELALRLTLGNS